MLYVAQDNYACGFISDEAHSLFYTDGATSCALALVEGKNTCNETGFALGHLSNPSACREFFELCQSMFSVSDSIYLRGCNPPDNVAARLTIESVLESIGCRGTTGKRSLQWHSVNIEFGSSHSPVKDDADYIGVDLRSGKLIRERINVNAGKRDPSGGFQMLFALFGGALQGHPALLRADHRYPLLDQELVSAADRAGLIQVLTMDDAQVLESWSTTPNCEAPWFVSAVREAAEYVSVRVVQR